MKLNVPLSLGALALVLSLTACGGGQQRSQQSGVALGDDSTDFAFPVTVEHAHGFTVTNHPEYKELVMYQPGTRDTAASYIL